MLLASVANDVLDEFVDVATTRACADEVTPALTPGPAWTPTRVQWLRSYHRDRRQGLDGPQEEATWAVLIDHRVAGSVRLKRTDQEGLLETGLWLARDARGRGLGTACLNAVLHQASDLGATAVCASTTASNTSAIGALRRLGFTIDRGEGQMVRAVTALESWHRDTDPQ